MTKLKDLEINNPFLENLKKDEFCIKLCRLKSDYELHLSMVLNTDEVEFFNPDLIKKTYLDDIIKSINNNVDGECIITPFMDCTAGCYLTFYLDKIEYVKIIVNYV